MSEEVSKTVFVSFSSSAFSNNNLCIIKKPKCKINDLMIFHIASNNKQGSIVSVEGLSSLGFTPTTLIKEETKYKNGTESYIEKTIIGTAVIFWKIVDLSDENIKEYSFICGDKLIYSGDILTTYHKGNISVFRNFDTVNGSPFVDFSNSNVPIAEKLSLGNRISYTLPPEYSSKKTDVSKAYYPIIRERNFIPIAEIQTASVPPIIKDRGFVSELNNLETMVVMVGSTFSKDVSGTNFIKFKLFNDFVDFGKKYGSAEKGVSIGMACGIFTPENLERDYNQTGHGSITLNRPAYNVGFFISIKPPLPEGIKTKKAITEINGKSFGIFLINSSKDSIDPKYYKVTTFISTDKLAETFTRRKSDFEPNLWEWAITRKYTAGQNIVDIVDLFLAENKDILFIGTKIKKIQDGTLEDIVSKDNWDVYGSETALFAATKEVLSKIKFNSGFHVNGAMNDFVRNVLGQKFKVEQVGSGGVEQIKSDRVLVDKKKDSIYFKFIRLDYELWQLLWGQKYTKK